uniref:Uncharacterized protein n=1 Tax=Calcidiscus leptoporus TaxID=127549 RepID=A0A7S0J387_9EUKA|mmetsp:Transcript_36495/g.85263  ORF Transcript_36495/g.85263 Transcript_36495/m.85263 type:complete len:169 (+) Transcript_36495:119-625(+)
MQALEQAKAAAEQRHSEVTAGLAALAGDGGGIMLSQEVGGVMDDDSPSDSESDGGSGALVPALSGAHGGNGAAASAYEDFASSLKKHKSERDENLRRSTEAARSAQERARHQADAQQLELERQRARERAWRDADDNDLDMMGQSKVMGEFERHDDVSFGLDEYGGGGY